jgi:hypothetical protein
MRNLGDAWSAGPVSAHLPPRPDVAPPVSVVTVERFETAPPWKRVGAVVGVIGSFFFLLTIPGWFALAHYRKWKRNEIPTPTGLIIWGYIWGGFMLLAFGSGFLSALVEAS